MSTGYIYGKPRELIYPKMGKHDYLLYERTFKDRVKNPDMGICHVIAGLAGDCRKTYCFPTQKKICELMVRFGYRDMSRRTLNRNLAALEQDGYVQRVRRHEHVKGVGIVFHSTLYRLTVKFFKAVNHIVQARQRFTDLVKKWRGKVLRNDLSGVHVPIQAQHRTPSIRVINSTG
jgi:DNA-binding HxlR family transcriptional regulator